MEGEVGATSQFSFTRNKPPAGQLSSSPSSSSSPSKMVIGVREPLGRGGVVHTPQNNNNLLHSDEEPYFVNEIQLNSQEITCFLEQVCCSPPGSYWYDKRSGLWGKWGYPSIGLVKPNLPLPGSLHPNSSNGSLPCWVNGRRVGELDVILLRAFGCPCVPGRWELDEGRWGEEVSEICSDFTPLLSLHFEFEERITSSITILPKGRKKHYHLKLQMSVLEWSTAFDHSAVSDFHQKLAATYTSLDLPKLPPSSDTPAAFETYFDIVFSWKSIRLNLPLLKLIGLEEAIEMHRKVEGPPLMEGGWRDPLKNLSEELRIHIGKFYYYLSMNWQGSGELSKYFKEGYDLEYLSFKSPSKTYPLYCESIRKNLLEQLNLPPLTLEEIAHSYLPIVPSLHALKQLDPQYHWAILWQILLQALLHKGIDGRVHVGVQQCARVFGISLKELAKAEGECAGCLQRQLIEMEHIATDTASKARWKKIGVGAAIGGGLMLVAGLVALPLLLPVITLGASLTATAASLLPLVGAGLSTGVVMAGSAIAAGAQFIPFVFAAGGASLVAVKVAHITKGIHEFRFVAVRTKREGGEEEEEEKPEEIYYIDMDNKVVFDKEGERIELPQMGDGEDDEVRLLSALSSAHSAAIAKAEERRGEKGKGKEVQVKIITKEHSVSKVITVDEISPDQVVHSLRVPHAPKPLSLSDRFPIDDLAAIFDDISPSDNPPDERELTEEEQLRVENAGLQVFVCVNGWLWHPREVHSNWNTLRLLNPSAEVYSLQWQSDELIALGTYAAAFVTQQAALYVINSFVCAVSTLAAAALAALAAPLYVVLFSKFVDNPWTVVANHAKRAGRLLYESINQRPYGERPLSLIGWSHGARVIFSALEYMVKDTEEDFRGIIENVFLIGAPVTSSEKRWKAIRPLVGGRLVNVYSLKDWLLPFLHRAASGEGKSTAGVQAITVKGVENIDVSELIGGHLNYNRNIKKVLELLSLDCSIPSAFCDRVEGHEEMEGFDRTHDSVISDFLLHSSSSSLLSLQEERKRLKQQAKVERKIMKEKDKLDRSLSSSSSRFPFLHRSQPSSPSSPSSSSSSLNPSPLSPNDNVAD